MFPFYAPWKHQKTKDFLEFSERILNANISKKWANPLSVNPIKWSNTLKQFVANSQQIVWVLLMIFWGWRLKG